MRRSQYAFGDGSKKQPLDPFSCMGAHHDEIDSELLRFGDDLMRNVAAFTRNSAGRVRVLSDGTQKRRTSSSILSGSIGSANSGAPPERQQESVGVKH